MDDAQALVRSVGFEYVELKPTHFLLSLKKDNTLILDQQERPTVRLCNFESLRRL